MAGSQQFSFLESICTFDGIEKKVKDEQEE